MAHSKISLSAVAGVVVFLVLMQLLYDPISFIKHSLKAVHIRTQLSEARADWEVGGIKDYSFEIMGSFQSICEVNAVIEVRNDLVVEVKARESSPQTLPPDTWADPDWGNEVFLCDYNHFTVPQMFTMLGKTLENSPFAILDAEFDTQYGFITQFEDGISASHGWLNRRDQSVYNEFQIGNFKIEQ